MTHCQECGRPWGLILKRGETPTEEGRIVARAALEEMLRDEWEGDEEEETLASVDWDALPNVEAVEVVFISDAKADFACDRFNAEVLGDCWQEVRWIDMPAWLLKGCKRRWAYRWDCCNIGSASNYVSERR